MKNFWKRVKAAAYILWTGDFPRVVLHRDDGMIKNVTLHGVRLIGTVGVQRCEVIRNVIENTPTSGP